MLNYDFNIIFYGIGSKYLLMQYIK